MEVAPLALSVLYPQYRPLEAAPKCISGRTSYHRVRLAFHSYPQLIRGCLTIHRFGPPVGFTLPSPWPWVAHPASGLSHLTNRPFRTRFRFGSTSPGLTSPDTTTPRLINQKARRHPLKQAPTSCRHAVSGLFHSPSGVLFTFPSRYWLRYRSAGSI